MNILGMAKGEARFTNIDKDSWNMIVGKMGKLPGELAPEIIALAAKNNLEFYTGTPQDAYPNALDEYRKEMAANNWDVGQDEEELFELAMHDRQYRDYKSGVAKERFNKELEQAREKAGAPIIVSRPVVEVPKFDATKIQAMYPNAQPVQAPFKGMVLWQVTIGDDSTAPVIGSKFKAGEIICFVQTYYGLEPVVAHKTGQLIQIEVQQGDEVVRNQILAYLE
jgi:pyruvate carboxylase subunit B